jgi:hypothetical protein
MAPRTIDDGHRSGSEWGEDLGLLGEFTIGRLGRLALPVMGRSRLGYWAGMSHVNVFLL